MWKTLLCRFGWHSWTTWGKPNVIDANHAEQYRACSVCLKQQRHKF